MIKPYYKHNSEVDIVEVEEFGIIDLRNLPVRVRLEEEGLYEIDWVLTVNKNGDETHVLSEHGGTCSFNFGGRNLGVIREMV
jgi:phosphopantothenate synthetase